MYSDNSLYEEESPLEQKYELGRELGRGSFSVVREATHKETQEKYAVKTLSRKFISQQGWINLTREIEIMLHLHHPNLLKLVEFIETPTHIHLVTEYMAGGELFEEIVKRGKFVEKDASKVVKQVLNGIGYLHAMGVAHRDLKPENLLCAPSNEDESVGRIVVADFGLAKVFGRGELLRTHCGTPSYAAPEIVRGDRSYDKSVDMWSIGVITYVLLCGFFPFYDTDQEVMKKKILNADFSFPTPQWSGISVYAKDFIKWLLVVDPTKRNTAEQAMKHPWIQGTVSLPQEVDLKMSVETFQNKRKLVESGRDDMIID